jgi:hemolysin III
VTLPPVPTIDVRPRLRGWFHAAMTPLAVAGAWTLLRTVRAEGRLPVAVFGVCLVALYATSSTYHLGRWSERARTVLRRCDAAMIQLFIAATFTPIAFHALDGGWRTWSLAIAWCIAIVGAVIAASPLTAPRWVGTAGYLAVGWLGVVPMTRIIGALPWEASSLILLGGVLYTVGGVVYACRWPDPFPRWFGFHEIFHLFVVAASTAHYVAIWQYVLPVSARAA